MLLEERLMFLSQAVNWFGSLPNNYVSLLIYAVWLTWVLNFCLPMVAHGGGLGSAMNQRRQAAGAGAFLHQLEDRMNVALVQQKIKKALETRAKNCEEKGLLSDAHNVAPAKYRRAAKQLDLQLLDLTEVNKCVYLLSLPK